MSESPKHAGGDAEQLNLLRDSVIDVVQRGRDTRRLRARRGTEPGYDAEHLARLVEQGWLGLMVPDAHDGLGLGLTEMSVVLQELGKGLMADPLPGLVLATRVLTLAGEWAGAPARLSELTRGDALPAVAWQEGLGGIDVDAVQTQATPDAGGWRLDGAKRFVVGAAGATGFIVSARAGNGLGLFWVSPQALGLQLSQEWRADESPIGRLHLTQVRVAPEDVILAPGPRAGAVLGQAIDETAVLASAEMLGVMEEALQMVLAYLRTRVQFDKPIGSFQALQHKAADLYVQQELLRAVLQDALQQLSDEPDATARALMASRCKARASDAGLRVMREVIQLHGAIGYTDEHDAGLYLKRALALSAWLGNASAHRARFGRLQQAVPA